MTSIFKIFISSVFVAFLFAKLTDMYTKFQQPSGNNEILNLIFNKIKEFLDYIQINQIKPVELVNFGYGFEGTSHIVNYLITFTPVFFVIFLILHILTKKSQNSPI